jgi:hypothetical protein
VGQDILNQRLVLEIYGSSNDGKRIEQEELQFPNNSAHVQRFLPEAKPHCTYFACEVYTSTAVTLNSSADI